MREYCQGFPGRPAHHAVSPAVSAGVLCARAARLHCCPPLLHAVTSRAKLVLCAGAWGRAAAGRHLARSPATCPPVPASSPATCPPVLASTVQWARRCSAAVCTVLMLEVDTVRVYNTGWRAARTGTPLPACLLFHRWPACLPPPNPHSD